MCPCNSIYKCVVKNCSLPHCRSKCENSNGVYLKFVSVTVSLPITFKAVSVLGNHFDEGLGSIIFNAGYLGRAWVSPTLASWTLDFYIYIYIYIYLSYIVPYICLDCNLTQPRWQKLAFSLSKLLFSMTIQCSVGEDGEKRHLVVAGVWTFTARGLEVVKWLFTEHERQQRFFDCPRWVADGTLNLSCVAPFWSLSSLCKNYAQLAR